MFSLTFLGGYINAYSYFTRGGAFVSMHTGNMAKIGISLFTNDSSMLFSSLIPMLGALAGAVFSQIVKNRFSKLSTLYWQKTALIVELLALTITGFFKAGFLDNQINLFLSFFTSFQLANFRKYEGQPHNTTIETGNIRTLGGHITVFLQSPTVPNAILALRYACLLFSFPLGAFVGSFLSKFLGQYAIFMGTLIIACLYMFITVPTKESV